MRILDSNRPVRTGFTVGSAAILLCLALLLLPRLQAAPQNASTKGVDDSEQGARSEQTDETIFSGPQPGDSGFIGALATGRVDGEVSVNGLSPGDPGFVGALASGNPNAGPGNNSGADGEGSEAGEGEVKGAGTETADLSSDD